MPRHIPAVGATAEDIWTYETRELTQKLLGVSPLASGSKVADGTEQDLIDEVFTEPTKVMGWINVSALDVDDVLLIREYVTSEGDEHPHATEQYSGAQSTSHCYFQPRVVVDGIRITIEQTAGVMRTFKYEFFKEAPA